MKLKTSVGALEIIDEPTYSFNSHDNSRAYRAEHNLSGDSHHSSSNAKTAVKVYGVIINGQPTVVFGVNSGVDIHEHSALIIGEDLYLAIANIVVCWNFKDLKLRWNICVDPISCFGVYYEPKRKALISHGELSVSRFTEDGKITWSRQGADILTGNFKLDSHYIEAIDFNNRLYRFCYEDGKPFPNEIN